MSREPFESSIGDQILSGVSMAGWLLSRPFVWAYRLFKWFIFGVAKEAGNRILQVVGGLVALAVIGYFVQFFLH